MFYVAARATSEKARAEDFGLNPKNRVRSTSEYVTLMSSSNLPELRPFIRSMVGLGIVISFLVVLLICTHGDGTHARGGHPESTRIFLASTLWRMLLARCWCLLCCAAPLEIALTF